MAFEGLGDLYFSLEDQIGSGVVGPLEDELLSGGVLLAYGLEDFGHGRSPGVPWSILSLDLDQGIVYKTVRAIATPACARCRGCPTCWVLEVFPHARHQVYQG